MLLTEPWIPAKITARASKVAIKEFLKEVVLKGEIASFHFYVFVSGRGLQAEMFHLNSYTSLGNLNAQRSVSR